MSADAPPELAAECWMYAYCARAGSAQAEALKQIKRLVVTDCVRTGDWDFSGVIAQAERLGHPEASWLPALARVLAGEEEPAVLSDWSAWSSA
ncbi:hypothetical protein [Aquimonas sp.]|jgi:hypothetical protein|uniref:hypothetical protein n=1 Tax=Aquimonas sp. TaxID=1872588 RepID=UPI0037C15695